MTLSEGGPEFLQTPVQPPVQPGRWLGRSDQTVFWVQAQYDAFQHWMGGGGPQESQRSMKITCFTAQPCVSMWGPL